MNRNRNLCAFVAGAFLISVGIQEARANGRPLYVGFRAGLGIGSQSTDPGETDGSRVGVTAGGVLGYPVTPNVAVETGLLYVLRGARYAAAGGREANTVKLDYLVIPALIRMGVGTGEGVQSYGLAGLDLGILMKAEEDPATGHTVDIEDEVRSSDLSVRLGAGALIPAGGYDFVLELAYSLGLTDIRDVTRGPAGSVENRTVAIAAGVDF